VKDAIDVGYRLIDGAYAYQNEAEVGAGIAAKIKDGTVKREDLFITSKLWGTFHKPELVLPALKKTLSDLGLQYLDLYLIHWPVALKEGTPDLYPADAAGVPINSDADFVDTWKSMEEAVKLGLVKSIGVSNFNSEQIGRILASCTIKPVTNQVECHPYFNQRKLQEWCKERDIVITGYSPLGSPDRPWATAADPKLLDDPKLIELGKKYGKSAAQIVLRWNTQRGIVTIP
jgi:aldehyde reductase